jgi:trimeric autotransporter adhesin
MSLTSSSCPPGRWPGLALLAFAFAAPLAVPLTAQCVPTPLVHAENVLPGVSGPISQLVTWDPDGSGPQPPAVIASGRFRIAGDTIVENVARLDPTTGVWTPLGALPFGQFAPVLAIGSQNQLFAMTEPYVRRWTGSIWAIVAQAPELARSLAVLGNGDIVVGGWFTEASGVPANGLARWDGFAWHDMGLGPTSVVQDVRVRANGSVAIAGDLITPGSSTATGVAIWSNGVLTLPGGAPAQARLAAEYPNGDLLVVTAPPSLLRRWDGTNWTSVTTTPATDVMELVVAPNGDVYVGGNFATFEGVPAAGIARFSNGTWSGLGNGLGHGAQAIVLTSQGVLAGGLFGEASGASALHIAQWNGVAWSPVRTGLSGVIEAILPRTNGDVIVAGGLPMLTTASGAITSHVARRSNGAWHALGTGVDNRVLSLTGLPNGDVVAGGSFGFAGSVACNRIAKWNGQTWQALGSGMNGYVHAVATAANGDVLAGGYFTTAGGVGAPSLARWNGNAWSSLGAFNGGVETILVLPNGDFVVGGTFTTINGQPHVHVARFDGTAWQPMGAGLWPVWHLAASRGVVHAVDGQGVWRWDGTQWLALPSAGLGFVSAFGVLPDEDLVLARSHLVQRFDGTAWLPFVETTTAPNLFSNGVFAIAADARGQAWLGGGFAGAALSAGGELASPVLVGVDTSCPALSLAYGIGCVGSAGLVQLSPVTLPWAGSTWRSRASGVPLSAPFVLGVIGPLLPFFPLQSIVPQALPGCMLYANPVFGVQVLPANGGAAELALALPPTSALVGLQWLAQVVPIEFGAGGAITAFTSSNALVATIGGF